MFPWGRMGLGVHCQGLGFYFFNYSAAQQSADEAWQTILPLSLVQGMYVEGVVGVGSGLAAIAPNQSAPGYMGSCLYFLTNSTANGDWKATVLDGPAAGDLETASIMAVSESILVCAAPNSPWLFWNLSADAVKSSTLGEPSPAGAVIRPFCTLGGPPSGQLLGSTGNGDLVVSAGSSILLLHAADIDRCRLSFVKLHSRNSSRGYSYSPTSRGQVRAVPCCGGGVAVAHSPTSIAAAHLVSLFNASVVELGGVSFEELQAGILIHRDWTIGWFQGREIRWPSLNPKQKKPEQQKPSESESETL